MKNNWYKLFIILALLCSYIMSYTVGYHWGRVEYAILYRGYSGPNYVALIYGIPYFAATLVCIIIAILLKKKKSHGR